MFFKFVPDHETLSKMQEEMVKAAETTGPAGPKMYKAADGAVVIDDPSLTCNVELVDEAPSKESLELTSMWVPNMISPSGTLGTWVPLAKHPWWAQA